MAKYLNLDGLQTLWTKLKNTFALKKHSHNDMADVAPGGVDSSSWTDDQEIVVSSTYGYTASYKSAYRKKTSLLWNYIKSKLGISSAVGSTTNPVYVDANGQLKAVGGTMLKQGSIIDTHPENSGTNWLDGTNEWYAFFDRGGTCTAYEYDLTWDTASPPAADLFTDVDLSSHATTTAITKLAADLFNSRSGYTSTPSYSGTKFAIYDLALPAALAYTTRFFYSFGNSVWAPAFFEVLVYSTGWDNVPAKYTVAQRFMASSTTGHAVSYGTFTLPTSHTQASGSTSNSINRIRIVMSKWSRISCFGATYCGTKGLGISYMSRTTNDEVYRTISPAINNKYDLGSSSHKWANVYATNFNGNFNGNLSGGMSVGSRVSSSDVNDTGIFKIILSSSGMTTQKPITDGYILHFNWDSSLWATQLFLPSTSDSSKEFIQFRTRKNKTAGSAGAWSDWGDLPANITGNANTATKALALGRNYTGRQSSINLAHEAGGLGNTLARVDLVTSSISEADGRPNADGFVMTFNWDSSAPYDTQIFIPNGSASNAGIPKIRFKDNKSEWGVWGEISIGGNAATATLASTITVGTGQSDVERGIVCHNGDSLWDASGITMNYAKKSITATTFNGNLVGNADTATKATQDGSGNVITSTYATKTELTNGLGTKQNTLTAQTAYSSKGSATKVPQITTNALGQVTSITEVTITQPGATSTSPKMDGTAAVGSESTFARGDHVHPTDTSRASSTHTHGNITNGGALQTNDVTIANGDKIVVTDSSDSGKVARTSIAFDGSTTTQALTKKGTWGTFLTSHQDISGKENSSNKVSSWSSTTSDTKYPSEKLVKTSLDGKSDVGHSHTFNDVVPLQVKTFENVLATAVDTNNANFYFGKLTPNNSSLYEQCRVRYRIYASIHDPSVIPSTDPDKGNNVYTRGWFDVEINTRGESLLLYYVWNNHSSTTYRTLAYHELGRAKSAYITSGGYHILGIRTRDAFRPTAIGWGRDYKIEILELEGCSFEFYDTMQKHSDVYTSNYVGLSEIDGVNNGLRESGDDNDTSTIYSANTGYLVGTNGMKMYSLCAVDKDGRIQSFTKTSGTGTTKTINDAKFRFPLTIYRYNQGTDRANGYFFKDNWIQKIVSSFDARYSCNRGTAFNTNAGPVYIEGTIDSDGYFTVSSNILTQTFVSGNVYIFVGYPYNATNATTNTYNVNLDSQHNSYYYDGTNLIPFEDGRYATKTEVTNAIEALDVSDSAVSGQVVSSVSETDGKISVARRALVAGDIPNLATSKITSGTFADERIASASKWNAKQDDISDLIPTAASASNPLCDKAYADAIGERLEARYLGSNANGDPFATHAALTSATKFYYQGAETTPDTNDITTVVADEDHKNTSNVAGTTRYRYGGVDASGKPVWAFEYVINNTGLSQAQLLAVNSGITATKVGNYDSHIADTTKHITAAERTAWNGKQNALTQGTNITISGNTISATDTTYSEPTDTVLQDIVDALT